MRAKALLAWLSAILASGSRGTEASAEQPKCVDRLREIGAFRADLPRPVNYSEAFEACFLHLQMQTLLSTFTGLSSADKVLCGDQLVPLRESIAALFDETLPYDPTFYALAVNLTTGRWHFVNASHEFACVLCQLNEVKYPLATYYRYEDLTPSARFVIHLLSVDTQDSDEVGDDEQARLGEELDALLKPSFGQDFLTFKTAWLDKSKHLNIDFWLFDQISLAVITGNESTPIKNGSFVMRIEDVDTCPAGETVDADGVITLWPATTTRIGFTFATNLSTGAVTRRDCPSKYHVFRAEWDPQPSRWELIWRNCTSDEQYVNEEHYKQFLDAKDVDRRHANALQELASKPVNTTTLQEVARLVDREVEGRNELYEETARFLVNISAHLAMDSGSDHFVATAGRADLIVADLGGSEPVVGFALECDLFLPGAIDNVTVNRKPTMKGEGRALFALDVSARLAEAHSRMAFVVVWKDLPYYSVNVSNLKYDQYVEVTVVFPRQGEVSRWAFASYGNHHVDIAYDTKKQNAHALREGISYDVIIARYLVCVAWSNDLRDWTTEGCKTLFEGDSNACRCSGKYFALQDGVPIAKFALKIGFQKDASFLHNNIFTDFLKDKIALMTVTAIECLLSLLGLGSIIGTAILFKHWRKNTGHKILLHMVLALTCNLVLGFITNFMSMDTEGVGCLVYGVLHHYSFLAMFFWMLVLSLLQMKRLMTVAGAKATTHLILKAAVFAWGMPLVPIIILLSVNPGFYQTDRFERGYCYPEGLVFQVTVQGPAGLILLVNLGIFFKIVLHIFGCVGEKKVTRHNKNEKAEQLNKLKTSLFIFFLFGFSWVFHILSEERVIVSDFLFEYLFLMTATTHIFVLALFFVVFQESTRKKWAEKLNFGK